MNNCKFIRKMFSEYIDGALPEAKAQAVKEHVEQCGECREVLDSMNAIIAYMNDMEKVAPPSDFLEKVNSRLERGSSAAEFLRKVFLPLRFKLPLELAGLAAAVLLIVYVSGFTGKEGMEKMAPRAGIAGRTEEIAVEAEARQIEVRAGDVDDSSTKPEELPVDEAAGAIALKDGAVGKGDDLQVRGGRGGGMPIGGAAYSGARPSPAAEKSEPVAGRVAEARQRAKGEEEAESITSCALSVNPPSDSFDSLLAAREGLGRELEAFVAKIGGRVVAAPEAAAPKMSLARAQSDRRAIRPLTVVIPGDSLQVFFDEIARLGKMRPVDSSIVSQTEDSATVRVDFR